MSKELKVPIEIQYLFIESQACEDCRDSCINLFFGAKRAIYYAKRSVELRNKAWRMIYDLYPETKDGLWTYYYRSCVIKKIGEK